MCAHPLTLTPISRIVGCPYRYEQLDRFKILDWVDNVDQLKLSSSERSILNSWNGTPVLSRPQHRMYSHETHFEVDIDAHIFGFLARKMFPAMLRKLDQMVLDIGFCIEGQQDDELPEQVIGAARLHHIDLTKLKKVL